MLIKNYYDFESRKYRSHEGEGFVLGTKLFSDEDFETALNFFQYTEILPNSSIGYHEDGYGEEIYIILEGNGVLKYNGVDYEVKTGDVIINKSRCWHGLRNISNEKSLNILVMAAVMK